MAVEDEILKECKSAKIEVPKQLAEKPREYFDKEDNAAFAKFLGDLEKRTDITNIDSQAKLTNALAKQAAVKDMKKCFENSNENVRDQLKNFRSKYDTYKVTPAFVKQPDEPTIKFLKIVGTTLAVMTVIGAFFIPKIWENKQDRLDKNLEKHLPPAVPGK